MFLGDAEIPFTNYTSPDYAAAEYDHMWSKTWQWACHVDHIPESGDYYVYDAGPHSALVVRTTDGTIKAYYNACMHRGTQLRGPGTCGFANQLKCPFHGWTWSLDGDLIEIPDRWDFPHVTDESHRLPQVPVDVFAGFVWVTSSPSWPLACVSRTWYASRKASAAAFQLQGRRLRTCVSM